jgi:hypothetical protein
MLQHNTLCVAKLSNCNFLMQQELTTKACGMSDLEEQFCCSCHATDMLQKFQKEKQILTILKKV